MSFIWPTMLALLALIPLGVGLYVYLQRRRRQRIARYGGFGLLAQAAGRPLGRRRRLPALFFLAGLTILTLSLARPQTVVSLPRNEGTVILAFDVSGSMAADDLEPTRIEAAKVAASEFVDRQPSGVQIGVVAFSDSGFSVQAPTSDSQAVLAAIDRLTPQRGTSLAQGILVSLNTLALEAGETPVPEGAPTPTPVPAGTFSSAVIVLFSDGANNEPPDPLLAAVAAANRGVRIYTVGIGSVAGAILNINGFNVHTRLDEALLQQISQVTGAEYYNAESEADLLAVYENLNPQLVIRTEETEVTSLLAGAGILALLAGGACSLLWFGRLP